MLCVNEVRDDVVGVDMSSACSVRKVVDEEQRVAHALVGENKQDEDQGREGVVAPAQRDRPLAQHRLPVGNKFRTTS